MTKQHTNTWLTAWRHAALDRLPHHREDAPWLWILAAQAETDPSLVRRMVIVEVLRDGRPHPAPDLQTAVEDRLGEGCFGAQAEQTLEADIAALHTWGIRIGHSDTLEVEGYYLKDPVVKATDRDRATRSLPTQCRSRSTARWMMLARCAVCSKCSNLPSTRQRLGPVRATQTGTKSRLRSRSAGW